MLVLGGASFTHLYAPSPYHRLQADALLKGDLYIGDSIYQIGHDLAWHDGQVNHLWGLGVGLWLVPFEAVWRLLGQKWFPDRIALGVAFALLAWYSGGTAWKLADRLKHPALGIGLAWLVTLCPGIWTLNQGPRLIYEETSLYACLVSLGILMALVRVACFGQRRDLFICAVLAALSALVRPTHGIYGLAGMLTCSAIFLVRFSRKTSPDLQAEPTPEDAKRSRSVKDEDLSLSVSNLWPLAARKSSWRAVLGVNALFAAGLVLLALTNWSRFGLPTEFGHSLSATPGMIVFMTRMGNPMREASFVAASRELFGALFLMRDIKSPLNPGDHLIPGEAPYARWRDPYLSTYDLSWAAVCLTAVLGGAVWIRRKRLARWRAEHFLRRPGGALIMATLVWAALSTGALLAFYLRFPNFSFRYLLDFAPAFTGFALIFWLALASRYSWLALIALAGWLGYEVFTAQVRPAPVPLLAREKIPTGLKRADGRIIGEFGGAYYVTNNPAQTRIAYNGYGWNFEDGYAGNIVILAVDRPAFVELLAEPRERDSERAARSDVYRAKIDNQFLPVREVRTEGDRLRVRFDVPEHIRRRKGDALLFLCFTQGYDEEDRQSTRLLCSVRWR